MDTPRSGFRRAAAASWALVGLGVAGVAGTSALAYGDTVKPAPVELPAVAVDPAPVQASVPALDAPPSSDPVLTTDPAPPVAPLPEYTPQPTETAQAPVTHEAQIPSTPPTTKRRSLTPTTVAGPSYSPRITMSRGS